jgi:hypothetical protein
MGGDGSLGIGYLVMMREWQGEDKRAEPPWLEQHVDEEDGFRGLKLIDHARYATDRPLKTSRNSTSSDGCRNT